MPDSISNSHHGFSSSTDLADYTDWIKKSAKSVQSVDKFFHIENYPDFILPNRLNQLVLPLARKQLRRSVIFLWKKYVIPSGLNTA